MAFKGFRGPHEDDDNCFDIRDFRKNDSIIVLSDNSTRMRGVVTSVDKSSNLIHFTTNHGESVTDLNSVVFLDDFKRGWLEGE